MKVFPYTNVDQFYSLPRAQRTDAALRVQKLFAERCRELFDEYPGASWVVLGLPTGEFLELGTADETPPRTLEKLREVAGSAAVKECVPIIFHRPRVQD